MSILRSKHSGWTHEGRRTPFTGGGGGGPTQSTTVTSNIPEYARPYVTNMFEATQQQLFEGTKNAQGGYDLDSLKGYKPYSTDLNNYFAGFSPLQQQAQYDAGMMQQPGQFALGSGLTGSAGMRSLNAGNQYAQNITNKQRVDASGKPMFDQYNNPIFDASNTTQSFMSPYQQGVTDVAIQGAVRDYQMQQNSQNLNAPRTGTYGGARQTLAQTENLRNLNSNLANIRAQGAQSAYDRAMQAQQFGANLGMQGLGQALGAGAQLGQLGATQQGADIARQNQMASMGAQQQALEQSKINQAIQDYATQQQYPLMQLGVMSNMLRGLPMEATNRQAYVAQPSIAQQGVGLLGAGATLFGGGGRREGGAIKEYREGGIVGYAPGGVIDSTRAQLEQIADMPGGVQKLEQIRNSSTSDEVRKMAAEVIIEKQMEAQAEQQTQKARMSGIAMAGGPAFESQGLAGGGIIAFSNGGGTDRSAFQQDLIDMFGYSKEEDTSPFERDIKPKLQKIKSYFTEPRKYSPEQLEDIARKKGASGEGSAALPGEGLGVAPAPVVKEEKAAAKEGAAATEGTSGKAGTAAAKSKEYKDFLAELKEAGPKGQAGAEYEKYLTERLGKSSERLSRDERMAIAKGFLKFGSTAAPGGIGQAALTGLYEYATGVEGARKAQDTMEAEAQKARMELDKARRAEERGDAAGAREAYDKYQDRINRLQASQISAGAAGAPQRYTEQQIQRVMAENPGMSYSDAMARVAGAGRTENVDVQRAKAALTGINEALVGLSKKDPVYAELMARRTELLKFLTPGGGIGGGQGELPQGVTVKKVG